MSTPQTEKTSKESVSSSESLRGLVINLEQYKKIKDERLKLIQDITTKFIDDNITHPTDEAWLDGIHQWAGNNNELQFYRTEYGIFLRPSGSSRSPSVIHQLQKAVEPFGFSFRSWGVRSDTLYLCFEETQFAVRNPQFKDEYKERNQSILEKVKTQ